MAKKSKKPRKFDAVKGGQVPSNNGAVLGGIEGLRQHFAIFKYLNNQYSLILIE